jgi:hypothetical protein
MNIELLNPARLASWCSLIRLQPEATLALQAMSAQVSADPELLQIFTDFHAATALRREWHKEWSEFPFHPCVRERLGESASLFYLLAYLSALPYTYQKYQEHAILDQIFQDTFLDVPYYVGDYYDLHGTWGYGAFSWIWLHLDFQLFRLGRLQYRRMPFDEGVRALRRRSDGQVLLLADPELPLRADGYALGAGAVVPPAAAAGATPQPEPEAGWLPVFESSVLGWRGHPVSPYGQVQLEPDFLPSDQWELLLQKGDPVLDIHIPRRDPLTAEACADSLQQALAFFEQFGPSKAFFCHTWFFTPQLQQLLPPESAIVRFQREFYLFPHPGGLDFLWSFAFGDHYPDRASAPRDTSLRRAVLDWLERGGEIFDLPGVLFHPPSAWGSQPYMTQWDLDGPSFS